ncbi:MAG: hypothetical protein BHV66_08305 [Alistipes putredinis]|uniref:Uncharacterized protein n=2 Tax=Alistipes putredinis TaxID=28117 RepID=A0A1Q6F412_9BACT|nr:MAG: hypothetical protein BHV66_08305 [Alistipes putredinis]
MIYKRIEAATGESAEKIEKAYFKKLEKILKRGVIKDREDTRRRPSPKRPPGVGTDLYELCHWRIAKSNRP